MSVNGASTAGTGLGGGPVESTAARNGLVSLVLERTSARPKLGLKGARAADWLAARGLSVPPHANTWNLWSAANGSGETVRIARLGTSEFFLEGLGEGRIVRDMAADLDGAPSVEVESDAAGGGVYPVLREDAAFELRGGDAGRVLEQVCDIDLTSLDCASWDCVSLEVVARPVVMTFMAAVSVLMLQVGAAAAPCYGIWCDPSFGGYLERQLAAIVVECGGIYEGVRA